MKKIIITIDGYSSCGKSTLAKDMADVLGYVFIDSGAMYRAITLYFLRNHVDWTNLNEVHRALQSITLTFSYNPVAGRSDMMLNGENVEYLIREMVIAEKVSDIAAIKEVREFAVAEQQRIGRDKGIIMDGRDIGTTVFPQAELKIFMTAKPEIRVQRRFAELIVKNPNTTVAEVKDNLEKRDYLDTHRDVSPLRQADDAVVLDNSSLTHQQQVDKALQWAREKMKED